MSLFERDVLRKRPLDANRGAVMQKLIVVGVAFIVVLVVLIVLAGTNVPPGT